jgi:hypothetical protein
MREAQKGSALRLDVLANEWPRNPSQSNNALDLVLRHLEAERRAMWELTAGQSATLRVS